MTITKHRTMNIEQKLANKYFNEECDCNEERTCSNCRNNTYTEWAKAQIIEMAKDCTFKEFEELAKIYTKLTK